MGITDDSSLATIVNVASDACYFAGCFPPSVEIAQIIPRGLGAPGAIYTAAGQWSGAAQDLQHLQQSLGQLCGGLSSESWTGSDRDSFNTEIKNLLAEIGDSHDTAEAIRLTLESVAPTFYVWVSAAAVAGATLGSIAAAFYAVAASVVGDIFGGAEAIYATGISVSEAFLAVAETSMSVMIAVLSAAAAVIAAAVATDVSTQKGHGDQAISGDLGQAVVDGLGQDVINAVMVGVSAKLDKRGEGGTGEHSDLTDAEGHGPSLLTRYMRGKEQWTNIPNRALYQFTDHEADSKVDRYEVPKDLQSLINAVSDRTAPDATNLEKTADNVTDGS